MNYTSLAPFPIRDSLQLIRSENVGAVSFFALVSRFGSPAKALEAIPEMALRGGRKQPITIASAQAAESELERCAASGARMVAYGSEDYPTLLTTIYDPPPLITIRGVPVWKDKLTLAIVGSRNASANGYHFAQKLAREAGALGMVIASGLARGIDTGAHKGALESGTVGVIAGGIDTTYPPENNDLYKALYEKGCVITENPFGMAPHSRSFPARNRIISGMSAGTLVVEASLKSGSLITARMALEQNRDLFAVPGSPLDPRCRGTNDLIRNGAYMCESIDDLVSNLKRDYTTLRESGNHSFTAAEGEPMDEQELAKARNIILSKLSPSLIGIDELLRQCEVPVSVFWMVLLELELAGRIRRTTAGVALASLTE